MKRLSIRGTDIGTEKGGEPVLQAFSDKSPENPFLADDTFAAKRQ